MTHTEHESTVTSKLRTNVRVSDEWTAAIDEMPPVSAVNGKRDRKGSVLGVKRSAVKWADVRTRELIDRGMDPAQARAEVAIRCSSGLTRYPWLRDRWCGFGARLGACTP